MRWASPKTESGDAPGYYAGPPFPPACIRARNQIVHSFPYALFLGGNCERPITAVRLASDPDGQAYFLFASHWKMGKTEAAPRRRSGRRISELCKWQLNGKYSNHKCVHLRSKLNRADVSIFRVKCTRGNIVLIPWLLRPVVKSRDLYRPYAMRGLPDLHA